MTHKRFGYEWGKYSELDSNYEIQFRKWISPLKPEDFKNKKVLDVGCGMGRNSYWFLKHGADVVAFDYDKRTVGAAKKLLDDRVKFISVYDISYKDEFDLAFSIGVIHHLPDPELAIRKMTESVKIGGQVLIWVYGYENNEWIEKIVSPVRKLFTSKLPPKLLDFLTYFVSVPFYLLIKTLPFKHVYLKQLKIFGFKHVHSIIFDQLLPEIAHYYTKDQARGLLEQAGLKDIQINSCNNNSWTVVGVKK
ncbi:MAG: class I SAM-dependent methyltransferase [Candidatus Marinimicrobia bacterium]|nr:class I SAM-dependent methyltransferase [Candidatus Neomarinimicrobiota bacterium]